MSTVQGKLKVGQKYTVCTGTIGRYVTFRGISRCLGSSERILLFENEDADEGEYRFIGAIIDLHLPYRTESTIKITGQLLAKYYGYSEDNLKRQGISQEDWELV
jgi:hypothetical protein